MSEVELRLTADAGSALREVRAFSREYQAMVQALEKPIRQANALQKTQEDAKKAAVEFFAAKRSVEQLQRAMDAAGQPVAGLERELAKAERTLARTSVEFDRQKARIREQRMELRQAGIDTSRLADEQRRLQAEMDKAIGAGRNASAVSSIRARAAALQQQAVAQRQANLEAARENLGVGRYRAAQAALVNLQRQYDSLRASGRLTGRELQVAQQQLTQKIRETKAEISSLEGRAPAGGNAFGGLAGRLGVAGGIAGVAALSVAYAQALDPIKKMDAQLKLATKSQEEFNAAARSTYELAQENQAPLEEVVTLYSRLAPVLRNMGRSQGDTLSVVDAITKSFRISGATAQETAAAIQQLSQALGSGALRGDEFNSVAEQAPRLMQALADSLQVNAGALRDMAADGQLTADVIADALLGQLPKLAAEAESLPETFSGAMTQLKNELQIAAKEFDSFSSASARFVGGISSVAKAVKGFRSGEFGDFFRDQKQSVQGINNEISVLMARLRDLTRARAELAREDPSGTKLFAFSFKSLADFDRLISELDSKIKSLLAMRDKLEDATAPEVDSEEYKLALAEYRRYIDQLKTLQDEQVKAAEDASKKLVAAEKKATADLERVRAERVKIERKYEEAKASFRGGDGEASYSAANSLRVQARQALKAGDTERAKAAADAALKMLRDLAAAGENTYGFDGIADDLMAIEVAANGIEEQALASKLTGLQISFALLADEAKKLENIKVSVTADEESIQAVRDGIRSLAEQLGKTQIVLPVALANPDGPILPPMPAPPGFATGGYTGPGGKYEVGGVVHKGEHVQPQEVVREPGALAFLERIRRNGFQATMQGLRGYAVGGLVAPTPTPIIPDLPPALMQQQTPGRDLGRVELSIGGESYSVLADPDNFDRILRRTAMKRGRTRV